MTMSLQALMALVAPKLAPTVYLHSEEQFFPTSVDWYLPRVALYNPSGHLMTKKGHVKAFEIGHLPEGWHLVVNQNKPLPLGGINISDADFETYQGNQPVNGEVSAPCYYHAIEDVKQNKIFLTFYFFYAFNGGSGGSAWTLKPPYQENTAWGFYSHEADWEEVVIALERVAGDDTKISVIAIDREAHGDPDWDVIDSGPVNISDLKSVIVYSAWHTHSSRKKEGKFTLPANAHDFTNSGFVWNTGKDLVFLDGATPPAWLNYRGRYGSGLEVGGAGVPYQVEGPEGPVKKQTWSLSDIYNVYFGLFSPSVQIANQNSSVPALTTWFNSATQLQEVHMVYSSSDGSNFYHAVGTWTQTFGGNGKVNWSLGWGGASSAPGAGSMVAVATHGSTMVMAAPDTASTSQGQRTMWFWTSSDGGINWSSSIRGPLSGPIPAMAYQEGRLHLVVANSEPSDYLVYYSSADGVTWTSPAQVPIYFPGTTILIHAASAALCSCNGKLLIAFTTVNSPPGGVSKAQIYIARYDGSSWGTPIPILGQFTNQPTLAVRSGYLYLIYTDEFNSKTWVSRISEKATDAELAGYWPRHVIPNLNTSVPALTPARPQPSTDDALVMVYSDANNSQLWSSVLMAKEAG